MTRFMAQMACGGFSMWVLVAGCSSGGGDAESDGGVVENQGCQRDSDCSGGRLCVVGQGLEVAASALTQAQCLEGCNGNCEGDPQCLAACADLCEDPSCDNICGTVCQGDAGCEQACRIDCEASENGGAGGGPPIGGAGGGGAGGSGGSGGSGGGQVQPMGVCRSPTPEATPDPDEETPDPPADLAWAGTWSTHVVYDVACDYGFNNIKRGHQDFRVTLQISGANGNLTADVDGYTLTGNGNGRRMTLTGPFPARDFDGDITSNVDRENQISLVIDTVEDANTARGAIEGAFKGQFGADCTINGGGTIELTR